MAKIRKLSSNQVVKDFESGEILYVRDEDDEGEDLVMLVGHAKTDVYRLFFLKQLWCTG